MEKDLIRKIYPSIAWTWAIAMIWCLALQKVWIALSITFGMILGTAILASYDIVIRKAISPNSKNPKKTLIILALIKYPLMALYIYLMVKWQIINMIAFCGGVILVNFAMFAKFAGVRMVEKRQNTKF